MGASEGIWSTCRHALHREALYAKLIGGLYDIVRPVEQPIAHLRIRKPDARPIKGNKAHVRLLGCVDQCQSLKPRGPVPVKMEHGDTRGWTDLEIGQVPSIA